MDKRATGGLILMVAVLISAILGRLHGGGVQGQAAPEPPPKPPAAGFCLVESGAIIEQVACNVPHHAQIVESWTAWDKQVLNRSTGEIKQTCWLSGSRYLQSFGLSRGDPYADLAPSADWSPVPLIVDTDVLMGPRDSTQGDWYACVLRPRSAVTPTVKDPLSPVGKFSGDIQALIPMATRPLNLRSCYAERSLLPTTVPCRSWHRGELLGARLVGNNPLPAADELSLEKELQSGCEGVASTLLQVTDPSLGGRLAVLVKSEPFETPTGEIGPPDPQRLVRCLVERPDGLLTDSLIGIGKGDLPIAERS